MHLTSRAVNGLPSCPPSHPGAGLKVRLVLASIPCPAHGQLRREPVEPVARLGLVEDEKDLEHCGEGHRRRDGCFLDDGSARRVGAVVGAEYSARFLRNGGLCNRKRPRRRRCRRRRRPRSRCVSRRFPAGSRDAPAGSARACRPSAAARVPRWRGRDELVHSGSKQQQRHLDMRG